MHRKKIQIDLDPFHSEQVFMVECLSSIWIFVKRVKSFSMLFCKMCVMKSRPKSYRYEKKITIFFFISYSFLAHLSWKLGEFFVAPCVHCLSVWSVCKLFTFSSFSQEPQTWHKANLGKGISNSFKWRALSFSKGRL